MKILQRAGTPVLAIALALTTVPTVDGQIGRPEGLYYKSWGVVIGIDDYQVAPKLSGAVADGKAVAQALQQLGFDEVVEVYDKDARFRNLKSILDNDLPRKVGRQDRVVLFFAGHAGVTRDMHGKELGYLVPWDAQVANASKAITLDDLKGFSRRVMSKHVLFLLDTGVSGWEVTPPQQLSLEGRLSPEDETDKRAVQVFTAANKGEALARKEGQGVFVQALLTGLKGAADENKNGWVMASELGAYVKQQVEAMTGGAQHPQFARLDGDGDTVLVEGKKSAYRAGPEPKTEAERTAAAKEEYERAFSILQQQKSVQEALERLNKAIEYSPKYGDAYVLKSYVYLEMLPDLNEALVAAELAVKHAPTNPDSHYTLGLVLQKKGRFPEAERALLQAVAVNPTYSDVYLTLGDLYAEDLKDQKKSVEAYQRYLETGGTENRVRDYLQKAGAAPPAPKQ
ncbi:MAG: tetratricopeptide repeat protein [Nitrospirae bacterium]|nr:tetratricopeptide repeat protein [Nitrospirota bacterium]